MLIETLVQRIHEAGLWEKEVTLKRNAYLKVAGSKDTKLYFVVDGGLRIFFYDEEEEHTIRFGYKNNFIAALDSFISEEPSDLYIQAMRKTSLHVLSKSAFFTFLESDPNLMQIWIRILGELIYQQMERERDILTSSPQERYQRVFERSPQLFQEIPQKYIASYLRMTPETLSRIKNS